MENTFDSGSLTYNLFCVFYAGVTLRKKYGGCIALRCFGSKVVVLVASRLLRSGLTIGSRALRPCKHGRWLAKLNHNVASGMLTIQVQRIVLTAGDTGSCLSNLLSAEGGSGSFNLTLEDPFTGRVDTTAPLDFDASANEARHRQCFCSWNISPNPRALMHRRSEVPDSSFGFGEIFT